MNLGVLCVKIAYQQLKGIFSDPTIFFVVLTAIYIHKKYFVQIQMDSDLGLASWEIIHFFSQIQEYHINVS